MSTKLLTRPLAYYAIKAIQANYPGTRLLLDYGHSSEESLDVELDTNLSYEQLDEILSWIKLTQPVESLSAFQDDQLEYWINPSGNYDHDL